MRLIVRTLLRKQVRKHQRRPKGHKKSFLLKHRQSRYDQHPHAQQEVLKEPGPEQREKQLGHQQHDTSSRNCTGRMKTSQTSAGSPRTVVSAPLKSMASPKELVTWAPVRHKMACAFEPDLTQRLARLEPEADVGFFEKRTPGPLGRPVLSQNLTDPLGGPVPSPTPPWARQYLKTDSPPNPLGRPVLSRLRGEMLKKPPKFA